MGHAHLLSDWSYLRAGGQGVEERQRLRHHLVHVVVAVGGQPAHEVDAGCGVGQRLVLLIARRVLWTRDRVVGVAVPVRFGDFIDQARLGVLLAGERLELRYPIVGRVLVGEIDHRCGQRPLLVARLVLEVEREVRQLAVAVVEELIHRPGVDHLLIGDAIGQVAVVGAQDDRDVGMGEHLLEHPGVAAPGHGLVGIAEVPVVRIRADRDACRDRRVQFGRVQPPVAPRVAAEERLVQAAAHLAHHHVLGGDAGVDRLGDRLEERRTLLVGLQVEAVQRVDRRAVDGHRQVRVADLRLDAMLVGPPLRELGEVGEDPLRIGVEDVRTVLVDEQPVLVLVVVGVAADVVAQVTDQHLLVGLAGQPLCDHAACESRSHHEVIEDGPGGARLLQRRLVQH